MSPVHIGSRREVCWDDALIEKAEGMEIKMHKPQYRGDALTCDKPWEGNVCCYYTVGVHGFGGSLRPFAVDGVLTVNTPVEQVIFFLCFVPEAHI